MDLSVASLFGYRSGSIKLSNKAWGKLEQCEAELSKAGAEPASIEPEPRPLVSFETASLNHRMERVESLLEELLTEIRGRNASSTSSKARGKNLG